MSALDHEAATPQFGLPGWILLPLCVLAVALTLVLLIAFSPVLVPTGIVIAAILLRREHRQNQAVQALFWRRMNLEEEIHNLEDCIKQNGPSYSISWQLLALRNQLHRVNRRIEACNHDA